MVRKLLGSSTVKNTKTYKILVLLSLSTVYFFGRVSIQVSEIDECRNVKWYEFEIEKFSKRGRGAGGGGEGGQIFPCNGRGW